MALRSIIDEDLDADAAAIPRFCLTLEQAQEQRAHADRRQRLEERLRLMGACLAIEGYFSQLPEVDAFWVSAPRSVETPFSGDREIDMRFEVYDASGRDIARQRIPGDPLSRSPALLSAMLTYAVALSHALSDFVRETDDLAGRFVNHLGSAQGPERLVSRADLSARLAASFDQAAGAQLGAAWRAARVAQELDQSLAPGRPTPPRSRV